jgi:phosphoribosylglycinamide formyltransferase-1
MRVGWLTSARDKQAVVLLEEAACALAHGGPEIAVVITPDGQDRRALFTQQISRTARAFGIPVRAATPVERLAENKPPGAERWRATYELHLLDLMAPFAVDLVVLAGYMWIAGPVLRAVAPMLNLHPALPGGPTGTQDEVVAAYLDARADRVGAMVHLVTEELDRGPVVMSAAVDVAALAPEIWSLARSDQDKLIRDAVRALEPGLVVSSIREAARLGLDGLTRLN